VSLARLKIGRIPYIVCAPYFYREADPNIEWIEGSPAQLNRLLKSGEIDAAPSSCIAYAQNPEKYLLMPHYSTGSLNKIRSVLLVCQIPLQELNGQCISLSPDSDTSNALTKILLEKKYGISCTFSHDVHQSPAQVYIGNKALQAYYEPQTPYIYDLAEEWNNWTGLPFSFGLWIFSKKACSEKRHAVVDFVRFLSQGIPHFFSAPEHHLKNFLSLTQSQLPKGFSLDFFKEENYLLTPQHHQALRKFFSFCLELNLVPTNPELVWFHEGDVEQGRG